MWLRGYQDVNLFPLSALEMRIYTPVSCIQGSQRRKLCFAAPPDTKPEKR